MEDDIKYLKEIGFTCTQNELSTICYNKVFIVQVYGCNNKWIISDFKYISSLTINVGDIRTSLLIDIKILLQDIVEYGSNALDAYLKMKN